MHSHVDRRFPTIAHYSTTSKNYLFCILFCWFLSTTFALFCVFLMFIVAVIGKPISSKNGNFPCGESPSVSKYIDYNRPFENKLLKIIHGHDSVDNDWPWIVTIDGNCAGSIISPNYVLTARHCLPAYIVDYGSVHRERQKHVNITEQLFFNNSDLGLVKVEKPFEFDGKSVAPICLSSQFDADPSEILVAAGFGSVFIKNVVIHKKIYPFYKSTGILQEAAVEHRADSWCEDPDFHPETQICIGGAATGVAHGDSGSPIMAIRNNKWYALGELFGGFFKDIPSDDLAQITHAWYTKVKPYCNWLAEVTHGEVICE